MIKNFFFFTATVLNWTHILEADKYKDILLDSFKFLVMKKRARIFAFVIMPNHFHTVWKINETLEKSDFQRDSMKYTGQMILRDLQLNHKDVYKTLYVGAKDRNINPVNPKWNLASEPQDYKYSSARFYYTGKEEFGFLENYMEVLND